MKLSIVIAAYNVEKFITKCIHSCLNQDILEYEYEIVVVNDGSIDSTRDILNSLQQQVSNLKVIHQENKGLGAARNTGIRNAKGRYLWFIDGDDYLEDNCLKNIMYKLDFRELDILALNYTLVDENYDLISKNCSTCDIENSTVSGSKFYASNYEQSYSWLYICRKSLFTQYDVCFKEKINMQDSEIFPKLLINADKVAFLDKTCYYYVQHKNSYTNSSNGNKRYNYFKSIIEVEKSLSDFQNSIQNEDDEISIGLKKKIEAIDKIIFYHLVFFRYEKEWLIKCINLLKSNGFYPLRFNAKGKLFIIKFGMNIFPIFTKKIIDIYIKLKGI